MTERARPNIVLTGFMGTGKSAVGMRLAARFGLHFIDMDSLIEKETGATIMKIFQKSGEAKFRELESGVIKKLTSGGYGEGLVVSTGGGAVINPVNRDVLKAWGVLVCLTASVDEILDRVAKNENRPLLAKDKNKRAMIEGLLKQRGEAYRDCHVMIDTTSKDLDGVVRLIEKALKEKGVFN